MHGNAPPPSRAPSSTNCPAGEALVPMDAVTGITQRRLDNGILINYRHTGGACYAFYLPVCLDSPALNPPALNPPP